MTLEGDPFIVWLKVSHGRDLMHDKPGVHDHFTYSISFVTGFVNLEQLSLEVVMQHDARLGERQVDRIRLVRPIR